MANENTEVAASKQFSPKKKKNRKEKKKKRNKKKKVTKQMNHVLASCCQTTTSSQIKKEKVEIERKRCNTLGIKTINTLITNFQKKMRVIENTSFFIKKCNFIPMKTHYAEFILQLTFMK